MTFRDGCRCGFRKVCRSGVIRRMRLGVVMNSEGERGRGTQNTFGSIRKGSEISKLGEEF